MRKEICRWARRNKMRIKTFEFRVSFAGGTEQSHIRGERDYADYYKGVNNGDEHRRLYTEREIDRTVNEFLESHDIIDIKVNSETVHRHNNAGCDSIIRVYTVLYK